MLLIGPALTGSSNLRLAFAASDTSIECKNAADKISSKAEARQSNNVRGIELSRDSLTLNLFGKKINDQVPMEFPYQLASATSSSQVLMLAEFTLVQPEVHKVNQYLRDHHWTVSDLGDLNQSVYRSSCKLTWLSNVNNSSIRSAYNYYAIKSTSQCLFCVYGGGGCNRNNTVSCFRIVKI
jgi:hypothetical protein